MNTQTLTRHRDIREWVIARHGQPAIRRVADRRTGDTRSSLTLSFSGEHKQQVTETPTLDDGISPVSWTAWLAELDRQNLALRVTVDTQPSFEFVERRSLN